MNKLKYFVFTLVMICMFLFSDASALGDTSRVSLHLTGTSKYSLYQEGEIKQGPSNFSLKSLFGTSFSTYSFNVGSYGYIYSSFLEWRVPVEIVKGYDKVSFTLGADWAYFNNASFTTGKGWLACQALSLPPTTTTFEGGFTSFVCDIDQSSIPETGEVTLYLSSTLSRLLNGGNSGASTITYEVFYQNDVVFYTNDATTIENSIKDQTDAINKQTESIDKVNDSLTSEESPDTGEYGNVAGWLPAGAIDSLINVPLTVLTSLNTNLNKACKPYSLPFINGTTIELPCIGDYLANLKGWGNLISTIDLFFGFFILYRCLMSLYKDIQSIFDLKNSDSELGGID